MVNNVNFDFSIITAISESVFKNLLYKVYANQAIITGTVNISETLIIPETINNLPVIAIGPHAFEESIQLKAVSLPDNLKIIGDWSFGGCEKLHSIIEPVPIQTTYCV